MQFARIPQFSRDPEGSASSALMLSDTLPFGSRLNVNLGMPARSH
jgi:hypothetical protein